MWITDYDSVLFLNVNSPNSYPTLIKVIKYSEREFEQFLKELENHWKIFCWGILFLAKIKLTF